MISVFCSSGNVKISSAMKCKEPLDRISCLIHSAVCITGPSSWSSGSLLPSGWGNLPFGITSPENDSGEKQNTSNRTSEEIQWNVLSSFPLSCFVFYSQEDFPFLSCDLSRSFLCALHLLFFSLYAHCVWMSKIAVNIWKEFRKEWRKKSLPFYFQFICCVIQACIDILA